jgi:hypothetical protein
MHRALGVGQAEIAAGKAEADSNSSGIRQQAYDFSHIFAAI